MEGEMDKIKKHVKAIYDHPKYGDRYTIYYKPQLKVAYPRLKGTEQGERYECLGCSEHPFHPQGIGQHGEGMIGRHNGKRISFDDLPPDVQRAVMQDLEDYE
jgi:hypothetical protein